MKIISKMIKIIRKIRQKYWKLRLKSCGKNFLCSSGVIIHSASKIDVGNDVRVGEKSYINARGGLKIGNNVKLGPRVYICTSTHNYFSPKWLPYDDIEIERPITINDNVWIGANANIIPGVNIGEGAVVAMGTVVTKDVPACAVVGGNPAKILKYRDIEVYSSLKKQQSSKGANFDTENNQTIGLK